MIRRIREQHANDLVRYKRWLVIENALVGFPTIHFISRGLPYFNNSTCGLVFDSMHGAYKVEIIMKKCVNLQKKVSGYHTVICLSTFPFINLSWKE